MIREKPVRFGPGIFEEVKPLDIIVKIANISDYWIVNVYHYGIYVGDGLIVDFCRRGWKIYQFEDFLDGKLDIIIERLKFGIKSDQDIINSLNYKLKKRFESYNANTYNCDIALKELAHNKKRNIIGSERNLNVANRIAAFITSSTGSDRKERK
jgi:hypothetical protein